MRISPDGCAGTALARACQTARVPGRVGMEEKPMRRLWSLGYCWPTCVTVVLILSSNGCLWIAAGGMGGAAVGYAYYKGKVCGVYNACLADTWAATHTALG